ncbi:MAG: 50S ribosomal protein L30 [Herpetosiphon sp.]
MPQLKVTYRKSTIGYSQDQKETVASLRLRKIGQSSIFADSAVVRGMCFKVRHLVTMEEIPDGTTEATAAVTRSRSYEAS